MQWVARWRIREVEARPVDAHRSVVCREHPQPPRQPVRVLGARQHIDVGLPAQLSRRQRRIARVVRIHPVLLLDVGEQQDRQAPLPIEQHLVDEAFDAARPDHRLRHESDPLVADTRAAIDELVKQTHERWLQR